MFTNLLDQELERHAVRLFRVVEVQFVMCRAASEFLQAAGAAPVFDAVIFRIGHLLDLHFVFPPA